MLARAMWFPGSALADRDGASAPIRYASSCSRVEFFAQAMHRTYEPEEWVYVSAAEACADNRKRLLEVYSGAGLRSKGVVPDALDVRACVRAAHSSQRGLDVRFFTPPCHKLE